MSLSYNRNLLLQDIAELEEGYVTGIYTDENILTLVATDADVVFDDDHTGAVARTTGPWEWVSLKHNSGIAVVMRMLREQVEYASAAQIKRYIAFREAWMER